MSINALSHHWFGELLSLLSFPPPFVTDSPNSPNPYPAPSHYPPQRDPEPFFADVHVVEIDVAPVLPLQCETEGGVLACCLLRIISVLFGW